MSSPTPTIKSLTSVKQCAGRIKTYGQKSAEIDAITAKLNADITALREAADKQMATLRRGRDKAEAEIIAFCISHKDDLLADGGKTAKFSTGDVLFRAGTDVVEVTGDEKDIIAALKRKGQDGAINTKESLYKTAIKKNPLLIKGVRGVRIISGGDKITIKPLNDNTQNAATLSQTSRKAA